MVSLPQTTISYRLDTYLIKGVPYLLISSEQTSSVAITVAMKTTVNTKEARSVTISHAPDSKYRFGGVITRSFEPFCRANTKKELL